MSLFSLIALAVGVSVDGFWGGFSYGLRKIRIPYLKLILIGVCTFAASFSTMALGKSMVSHLSMKAATTFGAVLIIGIGVWAIKEGYNQKLKLREIKSEKDNEVLDLDEEKLSRNPMKFLIQILTDPLRADLDKSGTINTLEALILGAAVAMDASVAAFAAGVAGFNSLLTPLVIGLAHILLVGAGNALALNTFVNRIAEKLVFVPGGILIILGLMRIK